MHHPWEEISKIFGRYKADGSMVINKTECKDWQLEYASNKLEVGRDSWTELRHSLRRDTVKWETVHE